MLHKVHCEDLGFIIILKQIFPIKEFSIDEYERLISAFIEIINFNSRMVNESINNPYIQGMADSVGFRINSWKTMYCHWLNLPHLFHFIQTILLFRYGIFVEKKDEYKIESEKVVREKFIKVSSHLLHKEKIPDDISIWLESDLYKNTLYILHDSMDYFRN